MCHVEAGPVDAQSSRLFGPGLQAVQLGRESQVFIELADAFGNRVESAAANGADLQVRPAFASTILKHLPQPASDETATIWSLPQAWP